MPAPETPYRDGMAAGAGVVFVAGVVVASADVARTGGEVLALFGLWSLIVLPFALAVGLVLAGGNATWGTGWVRGGFRNLREDRSADQRVSAQLIAGAIVAGVFFLVVGYLSIKLVGKIERKAVGAKLLGVALVLAVPALALFTIPLYRATRRITPVIPAIGPLSRVVLLLILGTVAAVAFGLRTIYTHLDHTALPLGFFYALGALPVLSLVIGLVAYGPLAELRERIPARGILALVALLAGLALPVVGLRAPSPDTQQRVLDRSWIGVWSVGLLRMVIDRDGDGHSAFFGGPDCDDGDRNVHPKAKEIPGNGIDDNCVGGDAKIEAGNPNPLPGLPTDAGVASTTATPALGGTNVLVIFVDTLRADRLGYAGYQRDGKSLTPRIDAFAKSSVVFTKAFAQAPNTPRSVPSFLGSRYPSQLQVDKMKKSYPRVLDEAELLFETLQPAGFTTIGESSHFYFCDRKKYPDTCADVTVDANIGQGADLWDNAGALSISDSNKDIAGPRILAKAIAKLEEQAKAKQKFAMLVHLFEPHSTYMEHPGHAITERGTAALKQKYDYEIAVTDDQVGKLLDALDKTGLAKTTTVVLMSDHGEAFGVHTFAGESMFFHGQTLYRELIHVPLIFRVPGVEPKIANDVVELIDLAPTIAALFGVTPAESWRGRSLVPALTGTSLPPKPAFAELLPEPKWDHDAKSMVSADGTRHVFYRISDSRWEIYDLEKDPEERTNIADSDPDAAKLKAELAAWIEGPLARGSP